MYAQQGDQLFFKTETLPSIPMEHVKDGVLVLSPVTGHAHRVVGGLVQKSGSQFFITGPAQVFHEEHKTLDIPEGHWRMDTVQEFDHLTEEARNVID